jgi:hypothetical protein
MEAMCGSCPRGFDHPATTVVRETYSTVLERAASINGETFDLLAIH